VYRDVDPENVPPSLAALNWIFVRDGDDFEQATKQLIDAMDTDLGWVKTHTRLTSRALEWETSQRNDSYLLRGDDLAEAMQYLSQPKREPALTHIQQEYIVASQEKQATDLQRELNQAQRLRQRLWLAVGLLATVLLVGVFAIFTAIQNGALRLGTNEVVDTIVAFSDAQTNSDICWGGALQGLVEEVMPACEMALKLEPDGPVYFESRGLARALLGDYAAAAADFREAVKLAQEFGEAEDNMAEWESWAQTLEQGQNPFDETLRQQLLIDWQAEKRAFSE
jgi:tetratricopeptide (TPR) repeat protein